jgi:hypothetical protein
MNWWLITVGNTSRSKEERELTYSSWRKSHQHEPNQQLIIGWTADTRWHLTPSNYFANKLIPKRCYKTFLLSKCQYMEKDKMGVCGHQLLNGEFKRCFSQNCEKRLLALTWGCLPVRPQWATRVPTGRIFMKFGIRIVYMKTNENLWSYLGELFLECGKFQTKACKENQTALYV